MTYYVSVNDNGKVIDIYGSIDIDPEVEKHEITDQEFFALSSAKTFDQFTFENGSIYADASYYVRASIVDIGSAVQSHLDVVAMSCGYDSIHTASLRAAIPNSPYHAEGLLFAEWMDQCYAKCYELIEQYKAGEFDSITAAEVISQLPPAPAVQPKPSI